MYGAVTTSTPLNSIPPHETPITQPDISSNNYNQDAACLWSFAVNKTLFSLSTRPREPMPKQTIIKGNNSIRLYQMIYRVLS